MFLQVAIVKKLLALLLILVFGIVPIAAAQVTLEVYEADGETPFDCNDNIMVGTELTLIISSDSNDYWSGGLFIAGQDRALGTLAGRGLDPNDPNARDYTDSHYEDAGDLAIVTGWKDSSIWGFDLYTFYPVDSNSDSNSTVPGDWFIIDYKADKVGDCNVGFYDYSISWSEPNYFLSFSHIPTRDLNSDDVVNFDDFAIFASQWYVTDCNDPNWCDGADLDLDGDADCNDLALFVEYWLWKASDNEPCETCPEDPNVIYSIVDANDSNEITINVNDSITLYVKMVTTEENNVRTFDIEVNISDTNLGSIDNTLVDSDDPLPTAQILAEPRMEFADYWGPGIKQKEGIEFYATALDSPISDGNLASFVFICDGEGDVTLELINWYSYNTDSEDVCPKLESIIIHQIQIGEMGMGGMFETQEAQESQSTQTIDIDKLVSWLEEIWVQEEETRKTYSEAEWNEFIDSVKNSYQ